MKKILLSILVFMFFISASADEKIKESSWSKAMIIRLNFAQTAFSNWSAGGENTIAFNGLNDAMANYKANGFTWDNKLIMAYGISRQGDKPWVKSEDKIDLNSQLAWAVSNRWSAGAALNLRSQFSPTYKNDTSMVSTFFSPAYINLSTGMKYKNGDFKAGISPISGKFTFVMNAALDPVSFGVDSGKVLRAEDGGIVTFDYKLNIMKNMTADFHVDFFTAYFNSGPFTVDVNAHVLIDMTVNKYIGITFRFDAIYDEDIDFDLTNDEPDARWQLQEIFGFGLTYKFGV